MTFGISQLENRNWTFRGNVEVKGNLRPSTDRYELFERFVKLPQLNATIDQVYTVEAARAASQDFEILGTNASDDDITWSTTIAGIQMQTDGGDDDQIILLPHLDTQATAWSGILWGTENQTIWECVLRTDAAITTMLIWAGLKLTNTPVIATDNDQVYFRFSTDDSNTTWRCISSIGGTDTNASSGVTVAVSTTYKLRIEIDSNRLAHFYVNDTAVAVTTALTNDVNFIPYVGVQALGAAVRTIHLCYQKISRIWFE